MSTHTTTASAMMAAMTGKELRALREAAGWSQTRVAQLAECGLRSVMRWEKAHKEQVPLHSMVVRHLKAELEAAAARRK
jgi:transcriptional regulator with XRE-family HTH domain